MNSGGSDRGKPAGTIETLRGFDQGTNHKDTMLASLGRRVDTMIL
jgi:hypothetical protein